METDPPPNTALPKSRRRWYQYSLRTLLIGFVVLSLPLGWLGWKVREARQQAAAVAAIRKSGGVVGYDYQIVSSVGGVNGARPSCTAWLRHLLGDDFLRDVEWVEFSGASVRDADLKSLRELARLGGLSLADTSVTDAGLQYLEEMTQLEGLDLRRTQVTDAGLERLKGLAQLKIVNLSDTQVTDAGVAKLQNALPNCQIVTKPPF